MPHLSSVLYQATQNGGSVKRIAAWLGLPLEFIAEQVEAARERTANVVTMEAVNEGTEPRPGRSVQSVSTNTMIMAALPDGETIEVPSGSRISLCLSRTSETGDACQ